MNQYAITYKNIRGGTIVTAITAQDAECAKILAIRALPVNACAIISITLIPAAWQVK